MVGNAKAAYPVLTTSLFVFPPFSLMKTKHTTVQYTTKILQNLLWKTNIQQQKLSKKNNLYPT